MQVQVGEGSGHREWVKEVGGGKGWKRVEDGARECRVVMRFGEGEV